MINDNAQSKVNVFSGHINMVSTKEPEFPTLMISNGETYHSIHGSQQESLHVFIHKGLLDFYHQFSPKKVTIIEMGFGTGLNAMNAFINRLPGLIIDYLAIEKFPLPSEISHQLPYFKGNKKWRDTFLQLHAVKNGETIALAENFFFTMFYEDILTFDIPQHADIVFYDAFSFRTQPELWTKEIFEKFFQHMHTPSFLVTYACRSIIRKNMAAAGLKVEKLPGPKGKREMLRAIKT